jgi:hypothetical protein
VDFKPAKVAGKPIQGDRKVPETESNCGFKQSKKVDVTSKKKARKCSDIFRYSQQELGSTSWQQS